MASLLIFNSLPLSPIPIPPASACFVRPHVPLYRGVYFSRRKARGLTTGVVTRAGPSIGTYLYALSLPVGLIVLTALAALKVAEQQDQAYFEELIIEEAMKEGDEDKDGDEDEDVEEDGGNEYDSETPLEEKIQELAVPRTRNRPKREA
ncbi:hypothetical protein ACOSP7_018868 [Xanthoceras sorbifolium]